MVLTRTTSLVSIACLSCPISSPVSFNASMATSFHRNARCPHIGLKEGGQDLMLTGGLLPFPRTGCVPYANASVIRSIQQVTEEHPSVPNAACSATRENDTTRAFGPHWAISP